MIKSKQIILRFLTKSKVIIQIAGIFGLICLVFLISIEEGCHFLERILVPIIITTQYLILLKNLQQIWRGRMVVFIIKVVK